MAWIYLFIAAAFEICFALGTNATHGFTRLWPSVVTVVAAAAGIFFLSQALRVIPVGVGYAVWTGTGTVGTVIFGAIIFNESITLARGVCFIAIIGGVVGLHLAPAHS